MKSIAKDPITIKTLQWVNSFPDVSETEMKKQVISIEKMSVEYGEGFI